MDYTGHGDDMDTPNIKGKKIVAVPLFSFEEPSATTPVGRPGHPGTRPAMMEISLFLSGTICDVSYLFYEYVVVHRRSPSPAGTYRISVQSLRPSAFLRAIPAAPICDTRLMFCLLTTSMPPTSSIRHWSLRGSLLPCTRSPAKLVQPTIFKYAAFETSQCGHFGPPSFRWVPTLRTLRTFLRGGRTWCKDPSSDDAFEARWNKSRERSSFFLRWK